MGVCSNASNTAPNAALLTVCACAYVCVLLQAGLALEWVYGYNASNTAPNAFYTSQQKVVYHVAALGVVYDPATHTQQFFQVCCGWWRDHNDLFTSVAAAAAVL
jgi:hypothetical protein